MQLERFNQAIQLMTNARIDPGIIHCANSASIQRYPEAYFDMGRVGITMYGLAPSPVLRGVDGLIPAMVKCRILPQGSRSSARASATASTTALPSRCRSRPSRSAMPTVCAASSRQDEGPVQRAPVPAGGQHLHGPDDGGDSPSAPVHGVKGGAEIGDEVVLIGRQNGLEVTADMMAEQIGTINYEIVCGFGMRLPRVYV